MFGKDLCNLYKQVERIKLNRKVLYHFAIFAIVNKLLITQAHKKVVGPADQTSQSLCILTR